MSGSKSSAPDSRVAPSEPPDEAGLLNLTVHGLPAPGLPQPTQTRSGRLRMLLVLLVCAAPVMASYFMYFVVRPGGSTNYGDLIQPQRPVPESLPLTDLRGQPVPATSLKGQWLMVVVAGGACDARCEKSLYLQRQLREGLGKEKDRVDKLWLIPDGVPPRAEVLAAISPAGAPATVLQVPREALAGWLVPAAGHALEEHFYLVDPMGHWMMRMPPEPVPDEFKRDLNKVLRATASWDTAGR